MLRTHQLILVALVLAFASIVHLFVSSSSRDDSSIGAASHSPNPSRVPDFFEVSLLRRYESDLEQASSHSVARSWNASEWAPASVPQNVSSVVSRIAVHLHVISIGDSLVGGFSGGKYLDSNITRGTSYPYTPALTDALLTYLQNSALFAASSSVSTQSLTSSYEYHGFPATISKKILSVLRRRFAPGGDLRTRTNNTPGDFATAVRRHADTTAAESSEAATTTVAPRAHRRKPRATGAKGYKLSQEQPEDTEVNDTVAGALDASQSHGGLQEGMFHIQHRLDDVVSRLLKNATSSRDRQESGAVVLVVVCNVLAGINDATLGIPWWWLRRNLQQMHDLCRRKAADVSNRETLASLGAQLVTHVVSVPTRIVPPYYYLISGTLAQTRRVSKRTLDPIGLCEFWFRSPRRKVNLHHSLNVMAHSALNSSFPSAATNDLFFFSEEQSTSRRRKLSPRRLNETHNRLQPPCLAKNNNSNTIICFYSAPIVPIDRIFVFPDKLVASALWKAALSLWSDCIHPSPQGYFRIAEVMADALKKELSSILAVTLAR